MRLIDAEELQKVFCKNCRFEDTICNPKPSETCCIKTIIGGAKEVSMKEIEDQNASCKMYAEYCYQEMVKQENKFNVLLSKVKALAEQEIL